MFKTFLHDARGNIGLVFGMMAVPLIAATGASIDYGRAYDLRMAVQDALDATALVANRLIGTERAGGGAIGPAANSNECAWWSNATALRVTRTRSQPQPPWQRRGRYAAGSRPRELRTMGTAPPRMSRST